MEVKSYNSFQELAEAVEEGKKSVEQRIVFKPYFATFGSDKAFGKCFVGIIAPDGEIARQAMFETFGKKWAFVYDVFAGDENRLEYQLNQYKLKSLCYLKALTYEHNGEIVVSKVGEHKFLQAIDKELEKRGVE